ncbi:hypothetical protein HPB49_000891 [Dermacentor silvarum]|uniref:Uncharacterized protein n=1 Tax=Dermacentor silvarum TaxID=543639 RepID=A0ACB8DLB5_DERSI|nr:hypothetical protein HPB49_000891 [Dermacentor silvarum]
MYTTHHPDWTMECVAALCNEPFQLHELDQGPRPFQAAKRPGSSGITFQMLRNLADAEKARLLDCLNAVWNNGQLPESRASGVGAEPLPFQRGPGTPALIHPKGPALPSALLSVRGRHRPVDQRTTTQPSCSPDLSPGGPGRLGGPPGFRGPHGVLCQD